jgi:hypothetical protein
MNDEEKSMKRLKKQVKAARFSHILAMIKCLRSEIGYLTSKSHLFDLMVNYDGRIERHSMEHFTEEFANKYATELNKFALQRKSGPPLFYWVEPISKRLAAVKEQLTKYE